jgi:thymidylate synthase (FAD)
MKIIDQSHEILSLPDNLLGMIEQCGRTCYKSENKIGCTMPKYVSEDVDFCSGTGVGCDDTECHYHSSHKFVKMIRDKGHHAMLEFGGNITVRFITNRGVTHELVRHRLFSFAQESTRYVRYDGEMEFIRPVWCSDELIGINWKGLRTRNLTKQEIKWLDACYNAEVSYQMLLEDGWRPEQAREVLPNSVKTEIVVKGNSRQWRHALKLRTSKKAHPQIRSLILPLLTELKEKVPIIFDDI